MSSLMAMAAVTAYLNISSGSSLLKRLRRHPQSATTYLAPARRNVYRRGGGLNTAVSYQPALCQHRWRKSLAQWRWQ